MQNVGSSSMQPLRPIVVREDILVCPECPAEDGYEVIEEYKSGDWVCSGCGLALGQVIDQGQEWRTFVNDDDGNNQDSSRVGGPAGEELTTFIGGDNHNSSLARADKRSRAANKTRTSVERGYARINDFCDLYGLKQQVKDQATKLYKLTQEENAFRGKAKQDALLGAVVFLACRQVNQPRTFREVHAWTGQSKKVISSTFKEVESLLLKKASKAAKSPVESEGPRPDTKFGRIKEPVARFVSTLGFIDAFRVETIANRLAERAETLNTPFDGRSPTTLAAAYVCMASWLVGQPRKWNVVAKNCRVGDGTMKTVLKSFIELQDKLVDKTWKGIKLDGLEDMLKR
ncbi:transcription initiation factor TFIIB [Apiospora sp. TS-2023a]